MEELDAVCSLLGSKDAKDRLKAFSDAEALLDSDEAEEVLADGASSLVDALLPALSDNNPKFVQSALGLCISLVEVLGEELAPVIAGVWCAPARGAQTLS